MSVGGNDSPCAHVQLRSIGKISKEENARYATAIFEHMNKHFGCHQDQYVSLSERVMMEIASISASTSNSLI